MGTPSSHNNIQPAFPDSMVCFVLGFITHEHRDAMRLICFKIVQWRPLAIGFIPRAKKKTALGRSRAAQ
jgi:hypothetical protein